MEPIGLYVHHTEFPEHEWFTQLDYLPLFGTFHWKTSRPRRKKGFSSSDGYIRISIYNKDRDYKTYVPAHRLAWFWFYGEWPKNDIHHKNEIKSDNRICNLQDLTEKEHFQIHGLARRGNNHWTKKKTDDYRPTESGFKLLEELGI